MIWIDGTIVLKLWTRDVQSTMSSLISYKKKNKKNVFLKILLTIYLYQVSFKNNYLLFVFPAYYETHPDREYLLCIKLSIIVHN